MEGEGAMLDYLMRIGLQDKPNILPL